MVRVTFEAPEHENIGNNIKLRFPKSSLEEFTEEEESKKALTLRNGVKLTYGQIIALAGDFYGIPDQPIVDPKEDKRDNPDGLHHRFIAAYNTLAGRKYEDVNNELQQIMEIMKEEKDKVESALYDNDEVVSLPDDKGNIRVTPKEVYDELGNSLVKKWDEVLGGKWIFGVPVILGRMMKLASNNHDHFLPYSKDAYLAGHELALSKAKEASKAELYDMKIALLEEAYSIDAFACHFLTDSFSSGHIRVPRNELHNEVTPSKVGDYLCKFMHDEDNEFGINVRNQYGTKWKAYGDGMLLNDESEENKAIAIKAVQTSVNHVYEVFDHPENVKDSSIVTDYIPFVDKDEENTYPMFQVKEGKLLRRADLENTSDPNTVSDWYGWATVAQLQWYKPIGLPAENCRRSCGHSLNRVISQ